MKPLARAGRNLAFKTLGEALARVFFLLLFIYAARVLGALDFGRYSFASALGALALVGMDLGLNTLFVRQGARHPGQVGSYAGTLLLLKALLALLVLGLIYGFCRLSAIDPRDLALVLVVALAQMCWGMVEFAVSGLNALERMDQEAWVRGCGRLAALVLAGGFLLAGWGLWGLVSGLLAANALALGLGLAFLRSHGPFSLCLDRRFLGGLFRRALPLALVNVFMLVYFRVDMVMLEIMGRSYQEIGWYGAAVRVMDGVGVIPMLVSRSLLPVLSDLAGRDQPALARLYAQGRRLLVIIALPAALGLWAVRRELVLFIYGPEFAPTARAFFWLAPALVFLFLSFLQLNTLIAAGRQHQAAWATGASALLNLGLNLALIPAYGFAGAAIATLLTHLVLCSLCAWFIRRLGIGHPGRDELPPLLAAAVMGLGLYFTRGLPLPIIIASAVAIYGLALLALGGLTPAELARMWSMLRRPAGGDEGAEDR